jgi:hypothetical protein
MTTPKLSVVPFFHKPSFTFTYVAFDPSTKDACVIDSALDYNLETGEIQTTFIDSVITYIQEEKLKVKKQTHILHS